MESRESIWTEDSRKKLEKLIKGLRTLLLKIPHAEWKNSKEIRAGGIAIQQFCNQFNLGVHIGITLRSGGPFVRIVLYPLSEREKSAIKALKFGNLAGGAKYGN